MPARPAPRPRTGLVAGARRRRWPIVATLVTLVAGMAYTLLADFHRQGVAFWMAPGDIWGAYRSAHLIGWGDYGAIYSSDTGLVTFPGVLLLLTPVAMLTGALGLSESFPFTLPHPMAWLLLGPAEILISCSALFACDALAERVGVSRGRRFWLCAAEAVVLWNVDVVWGHPEDALALALAVYALVAALNGRWRSCGWLFGAAIATQPLVILAFPVIIGLGRGARWLGLAVRGAVPTVVLMAIPFATNLHATARSVLEQPNFPFIDHVTPWTALAPRIGGHGRGVAVAAGPGRVVAVLLACGIGAWVWRHRPSAEGVVVAVAVALALRCLTESVMVAFYLWPPLAVALVGAARAGRWRLAVAATAAAGVTVFSDYRVGPWWVWWGCTTLALVVVLLCAVPRRARRTPSDQKNRSSSPAEMPEQLIENGSVLTAPP